MRSSSLAAGCLALALAAAACAAPPEADEDASDGASAISNGTTTADSAQSVGQLVMSDDGETHYCTAALVAPDVVLTAAKCMAFFHAAWNEATPIKGSFFLGARLDRSNALTENVGEIALVGAKDVSSVSEGLALVHLTAPLSGAKPVTLSTRAPAKGDKLTMYGYGCNETRDDFGVLRKTTLTWGKTFGSSAGCSPGDDGAPVFDASGKLVGVLSEVQVGITAITGSDDIVLLATVDAELRTKLTDLSR